MQNNFGEMTPPEELILSFMMLVFPLTHSSPCPKPPSTAAT